MNIKYKVKWLKQIDLHQLFALKKKMEVDKCFTCKLSLRGVKLDNGLTTKLCFETSNPNIRLAAINY
jgi:sulfur relay (sulfurtransferase) DsrF/TusC family protein